MNLFEHYKAINKKEKKLNINNLSAPTRKVYALIDSEEKITTAQIQRHLMFADTSLSTIKRVVAKLIDEGLIEKNRSESDKREKYLFVKKGD